VTLEQTTAQYADAQAALYRAQVEEELAQLPGLAYRPLSGDPLGEQLVALDGVFVGIVWTTTPGAVLDWHARPLHGDVLPGSFHTARAAAASLIPRDHASGDGESTRD
jgi:hypothetical protein